MSLREKIDLVLKDYGVDWKMDGGAEYYEALKDELIIVIERQYP